jgi:arginine repressor
MFLKSEEGINISMSTLRRHLKSLGLFRRKAQSDLLQVALFLQEQLNQYGMLHGYKLMNLKYNYTAPALNPRPSRSTTEET